MHNDENDNTLHAILEQELERIIQVNGGFQTIGDVPAFLIAEDKIIKNISKDFSKIENLNLKSI